MSLKNYFRRRVYKERAQPSSRKKFGLLEKHKDYVERAKAYHKKEDTLRRLREKAANKNPDEFYFEMIDEIHRTKRNSNEVNNFTREELLLMKTQDIGYVVQKVEREKKRIEKLTASLHLRDKKRLYKHVFAEDSKTERSYKELEARRNRLSQLEKIYMDMKRTSKWI